MRDPAEEGGCSCRSCRGIPRQPGTAGSQPGRGNPPGPGSPGHCQLEKSSLKQTPRPPSSRAGGWMSQCHSSVTAIVFFP